MHIAPRTLPCPVQPTERLRRALARFGLAARLHPAPPPRPARPHLDALLALAPGEIALVTAPSGRGKSTLLRALADALRRSNAPSIDAAALLRRADADTPLPDLLRAPPDEALRTLARAGLAEPALWARTPAGLSEGESARLAIALAMSEAGANHVPGLAPWIVIDECCSTLDRPTAHSVARALRRWTRATPIARVVCATAHDDLASHLDPDLLITPEPIAAAA